MTDLKLLLLFKIADSAQKTAMLFLKDELYNYLTKYIIIYLMFIGPCIIVIVEEWKTNLMSLAILFHFLCAQQHVSDINISIIRSLRLFCWITTSVVLFCKDGWFSVSVNLRCIMVCVWCDVFCRFVVVGRCILIDFDRYLLCFVITVFVCVWYFSLVVW